MKYPKLCIICLLAVGLTQCKTGKPDDFDYGTVENNVYKNTYFGMTMDIPEGWAVQSDEAMKQMSDAGKELIVGDDMVMKAQLKVSEINSANLISVFQHEVGSPIVGFNGNIVMVAENLALAPGVKKGADYLRLTKQLLQKSAADYDFEDEFASESFGGKSFDYLDATLTTSGIQVGQRFYSTIINGFSFCAIVSYGENEQKELLIDVLKTIDFE